ncbi:hypothetical protein BLNAU_8400 [Blattamonas nauphoetae]|uniref:Uncharacterized protein n=1 Tax=Blattamonas nauphoetae TaxID=2049346 RepID=A0ABQ9XYL4_9EUKA|nr:hypothetical protein BLNAU_8400 [Blattamonas nauphoetae]
MCQDDESASIVPVISTENARNETFDIDTASSVEHPISTQKNTWSLAHPKKANDSNELRARKRNQSIPELKTAITHTDGWWDGPIVKRTRNPYHPGELHTCSATRDCELSILKPMNTRLILTPLQSSECDLERIHSDEPVSSDAAEEPELMKFPTFLAIDIGDPRTSDGDIRTFLKSLTTYMQDTSHIALHILDRIITILEQLQRRISSPNRSQDQLIFLFPCLDRITDHPCFETWPWHVLLSAHNTRLSIAVLDILQVEIFSVSSESFMTTLISGLIPSVLSALGEESLLSLPLSDPLPDALFDFLMELISSLNWHSPLEVASLPEEFTSQLFDHLLVPLRSLLIQHLKSPTSISNCEFGESTMPKSVMHRHFFRKVPPNNQLLPILHLFRQFASLQQGQNEFVAFLMGVMQEVWEERRREGLVLDGPVPLFVSTPLRPNMTPPEMVPLLDSANAFLASTHPLSDSDAVTVTLFLMSLDNIFFIKKGDSTYPITFLHLKSLSSCPPFARSVAKLILLSLTCSHFEIVEESEALWTKLFFSPQRLQLPDIVACGFVAVLAEAAQTLQTGWSDEKILDVHCFFTDIVILIVDEFQMWRSTPETDSDIELFQRDQQIIVNNVLVPLRQSLVHCARTNTRIAPHFRFLSCQDINHPSIVPFFAGVWEEVRREAIGVVCGEDETEAPVFLTMDLFSRLSMEETELGLSSLSSYLSTTPSPPPPVASCIHLFLRTIRIVSSLSFSEWKRTMKPANWFQIDSQLQVWIRSHRNFATCFAEFVPTLLLARNDNIQFDVRWIIFSVMGTSFYPSESVLPLAEAGLVSNMALVLMKAQSQTNSRDFIKHANSHSFLTVVNTCLTSITSSFQIYIEDQLRESERITRILIEKVLIPAQPFLTSLFAPLSISLCVDQGTFDLRELLETIGTAEWYYPKLMESLVKCGLHVATMRFYDLTEKAEHQVSLLAFIVNTKYYSAIINRRRSSSNIRNLASSKLIMPTLREKMKGRNEEGFEDLVEKNLLSRDLSDLTRTLQSRTYKLINNTGINIMLTEFQ